MQITVLSDGAWGTALALLLCETSNKVTLWGAFPDYIEEMRKTRVNSKFLPGFPLSDKLQLSDNLEQALSDAETLILATPSQYMTNILEKVKPLYNDQLIVNVSKGIENNSLKRMSELVFEILEDVEYAVLSGPSHAEEVAAKKPTVVTVASTQNLIAKQVQDIFMNDYFRIYTSNDVVGVELGGALKNVFAIAAGIIDGMKLGDNAKAALMTRGVTEMARLGIALGGNYNTFSGLSGIGDLIVTCTSGHSRNRHVGEELGKGKSLDDILQEMGMVVAEGVRTTESVYELAEKNHVETPIINEVYLTLYKGKDPRQAVIDLMTREAKSELDM